MNISFESVKKQDYPAFRKNAKDIFSIAVIEEFGKTDNKDVTECIYHCDEYSLSNTCRDRSSSFAFSLAH